MVWEIMSYRALSELHFVPPKQMATSILCGRGVGEILSICDVPFHEDMGYSDQEILPNMSHAISCKMVLQHTPLIAYGNGTRTTCPLSGPKGNGLVIHRI